MIDRVLVEAALINLLATHRLAVIARHDLTVDRFLREDQEIAARAALLALVFPDAPAPAPGAAGENGGGA